MESLQFYASFYYSMGMNVAPIYAKSEEDNFKVPQKEIFEKWKDSRQNVEDVMTIDWQSATGLGLISGINNLRVLDIDNVYLEPKYADDDELIPNFNFLPELLESLGLPKDYHWVIKSGGQQGLHIIIGIENISEVKENVFPISSKYSFQRIDFLWRYFSVLPPSKHKSGNRYEFVNCDIPQYKPYFIDIENLYLCSIQAIG